MNPQKIKYNDIYWITVSDAIVHIIKLITYLLNVRDNEYSQCRQNCLRSPREKAGLRSNPYMSLWCAYVDSKEGIRQGALTHKQESHERNSK